jgi:hypothetical protein
MSADSDWPGFAANIETLACRQATPTDSGSAGFAGAIGRPDDAEFENQTTTRMQANETAIFHTRTTLTLSIPRIDQHVPAIGNISVGPMLIT